MAAMSEPLDLTARMVAAIETGDVDALAACYSPDVTVWANFDDRARDLDSALRVVGWLIGQTSERRYEIVRRIEIDGGVLQQHVLHGVAAATGRAFSMPACLVVRVDGGLITRIDEYLDPAAMQPAFAAE
jgi:ketosteroid isomerase-like protein